VTRAGTVGKFSSSPNWPFNFFFFFKISKLLTNKSVVVVVKKQNKNKDGGRDHYLSRPNEASLSLEPEELLFSRELCVNKQNRAKLSSTKGEMRGKNMKRERELTRKADSIIQIEKIML
jgi:hypothetical protein